MTEQEYADLQTLEALRGCRALLKGAVGDVTKIENLISIKIGKYEKLIVIEENCCIDCGLEICICIGDYDE